MEEMPRDLKESFVLNYDIRCRRTIDSRIKDIRHNELRKSFLKEMSEQEIRKLMRKIIRSGRIHLKDS